MSGLREEDQADEGERSSIMLVKGNVANEFGTPDEQLAVSRQQNMIAQNASSNVKSTEFVEQEQTVAAMRESIATEKGDADNKEVSPDGKFV